MAAWKRILLALVVALAYPTPAYAQGSTGFADEVAAIVVLILIFAGVLWLYRPGAKEDAEARLPGRESAEATYPSPSEAGGDERTTSD
jgi:cbb3-type cytochrome oxidase subunit 3